MHTRLVFLFLIIIKKIQYLLVHDWPIMPYQADVSPSNVPTKNTKDCLTVVLYASGSLTAIRLRSEVEELPRILGEGTHETLQRLPHIWRSGSC